MTTPDHLPLGNNHIRGSLVRSVKYDPVPFTTATADSLQQHESIMSAFARHRESFRRRAADTTESPPSRTGGCSSQFSASICVSPDSMLLRSIAAGASTAVVSAKYLASPYSSRWSPRSPVESATPSHFGLHSMQRLAVARIHACVVAGRPGAVAPPRALSPFWSALLGLTGRSAPGPDAVGAGVFLHRYWNCVGLRVINGELGTRLGSMWLDVFVLRHSSPHASLGSRTRSTWHAGLHAAGGGRCFWRRYRHIGIVCLYGRRYCRNVGVHALGRLAFPIVSMPRARRRRVDRY